MVRGKFLSKDGQWYDTPSEKFSADLAWDVKQGTQEKQNRLLQQQNRLMEQQMQMQYDLEQEKIQKDYEIEMKKLAHAEKMRILRLFDDIGISKETYDTFINTNFLNKTNVKLMEQRDEHLLMSSKYDYLLHEDENEEKYGYDNYDATMERYDMYNLKAELQDDECYDKVNKSKQKEIDELKSKLSILNGWFSFLVMICVFFFAISMYCITNEVWYTSIIWWLILIAITVIVYKIYSSYDNKLKAMPEKTFNQEKYIAKLNKLMLEEQEAADKITKTIKANNESLVSKFYDFRINHYNASIEKLLVDVGFKDLVESLGLEYKKVNNSNKKKAGTIEDYTEYFETNS